MPSRVAAFLLTVPVSLLPGESRTPQAIYGRGDGHLLRPAWIRHRDDAGELTRKERDGMGPPEVWQRIREIGARRY